MAYHPLLTDFLSLIFNKPLPIRKKHLRAKKAPFMTKYSMMLLWRHQDIKISRDQDISQTSWENYMQETLEENQKNRTLKTLTWKKSRIIETFGNLIFLFSQKGVKRWKDYPYWSRKTYFWISNDKKICTIFNNFFSNVVSDLKIPSCCDYYSPKNTISLKYHQISLKRLKNTSVFSILKKGNLI